ncbi:hypothetical protein [Clostridium sp.]|uniref:hypothetical protein n=1 Tax=Clostridium sp. TaxID=1506 RepID=UPI002FC645BE
MGTSKGYLPPTGQAWSETKRAVTGMVKNNFQRSSIGKAMGKFSNAMMSSNSGTGGAFSTLSRAGSRSIEFFSNSKLYGFNEALNRAGLQDLVGKSNEEVYMGLLDYFAGDGSSLDKNIVRDSMSELLMENMLGVTDEQSFDDIIQNMDMNKFIVDFITAFTQKSFLTNFSEKIEGLCKNLNEYIKAENIIKDFIRVEIERKYTFEDLSKIEWKSHQGRDFIDRKCREAFEIFKMWKEDLDENMD